MPNEMAIITEVISIRPDQTILDAMAMFDKHNIRCLPVIDEANHLLGIFSSHQLLRSLLPVSVTMEDGLQRLSFMVGAAPSVAQRLQKMKSHKVSDHMERDVVVVEKNTPTWEAVRLLVKYGSPLPVVDEGTGKLVGIISEQSAISELERLYQQMLEEGDTEEDL